MLLRIATVLSLFFATTFFADDAKAQQWNDGAFSTMGHLCWQGLYPSIPEVLAYTYVGFTGLPEVGQVYKMRVVVAGLGCSGAYVLPEVKLPRATRFAISAANPVVCRLGNFGAAMPLTDGSCPQSPSTAGTTHAGFYTFVPTVQPYWPLPPGKELIIEFPVISDEPLYGLGSATDFLIGGATFLDNSPGNPVPSYDIPQAGYSSGIPSGGAWQGVYVKAASTGGGVSGLPAGSTNSRFAFGDTDISNIVEQPDGTVTLDVQARIYNADCFCNAPTGCPYTVEGCCSQNGTHYLQEIVMSFVPKDPAEPDTVVFDDYWNDFGCLGQQQSGMNTQYFCKFRFSGIKYGIEYVYQTTPRNGAVYRADADTCAPTGTGPSSSELRTLYLANPDAPVRYRIISSVEGQGSVALLPESSCSGAGDCATGAFVPGASVTATATPASGAVFDHWVVDAASSSVTGPLSFTALDKDHAITAVFVAATGTPGEPSEPGDDDQDDDAQDGESSGGCNATGASTGFLMAGLLLARALRRRV